MKVLALGILLLAAGCDRMIMPQQDAVYAPREAGLTLVYQNPSAPERGRLQVRVKHTEETSVGLEVVETFTTLTGQSEATFRQKEGLVALKVDGTNEINLLPEGFPDRVSRWEERGFMNFVVGRSQVDLPGVKLPDPDAVGVWVESVPPSPGGVRRRTLLVPNYGEVETLNWKNGRWVIVNILVSQGFTDPPPAGSVK